MTSRLGTGKSLIFLLSVKPCNLIQYLSYFDIHMISHILIGIEHVCNVHILGITSLPNPLVNVATIIILNHSCIYHAQSRLYLSEPADDKEVIYG